MLKKWSVRKKKKVKHKTNMTHEKVDIDDTAKTARATADTQTDFVEKLIF